MMDEQLVVALWLSIGGLILIWGNLSLWHTRRVLRRLRVNVGVPSIEIAPTAMEEPVDSEIAS